MACSTADAFHSLSLSDHAGKLRETPPDKKQKMATNLLRDGFYQQNLQDQYHFGLPRSWVL